MGLIRGQVDAYWTECCQIWDHAPWVLLVAEAGGRFTDHQGGASPDQRGGLYSNALIHESLRAHLIVARERRPAQGGSSGGPSALASDQ